MTRPEHLPDFADPPIDEVAIGFHFDRVDGFTDVHAGLYWQRVRATYGKTQTRSRSEIPIEDLTNAWSPIGLPSFEVLAPDAPIANRTWLMTQDEVGLVQVQDNQFIRNWRRRGNVYPHLDDQIQAFWLAWDQFCHLVNEEGFEQPKVRQLEVSYFNWITPPKATWFRLADALAIDVSGLGSEPDRLRLATSYLDHGDDGVAQGRLTVEIQPALRNESGEAVPGYRLVLSYKAPHPSTDKESLNRLIHRAREVIDLSFVELTSSEAHRHWGRTK